LSSRTVYLIAWTSHHRHYLGGALLGRAGVKIGLVWAMRAGNDSPGCKIRKSTLTINKASMINDKFSAAMACTRTGGLFFCFVFGKIGVFWGLFAV
jgi:hypothetical protein